MSFLYDFIYIVVAGIVIINVTFEIITYLTQRLLQNNVIDKNQINITIKHAGNQAIREFRDKNGNYKDVYVTFDKTKTVGDLKQELTKHLQYTTTEKIRLLPSRFAKQLVDEVVLDWIRKDNNKNKFKNEEFKLFIWNDAKDGSL
jgi:hypothetical protein